MHLIIQIIPQIAGLKSLQRYIPNPSDDEWERIPLFYLYNPLRDSNILFKPNNSPKVN